MARYQCAVCGYVYDEATEGAAWAELPEGWVCPHCAAAKSAFGVADADGGSTSNFFPAAFLRAHRIFGYIFLAVYLVLLLQMVPRLWSYQIEFPARTVVHIALGMAIGAVLLLKILIVRYFKKLDNSLVPLLGTSLFVASVILIGISAPFAFQEAFMQRAAAAEGLFAEDNLGRVRELLRHTGIDEFECVRLTQPASLRAGREVLLRECVQCHDLRTVLAKPRTPENWLQTVRRMADRTTSLAPLKENEQWQVTTYLIAISPQLQKSSQKLRAEMSQERRNKDAADAAVQSADTGSDDFSLQQAKSLFEVKCSECHEANLVESTPPTSAEEAKTLVRRMVDEGMTGTEPELSMLIEYLKRTYVPDASS